MRSRLAFTVLATAAMAGSFSIPASAQAGTVKDSNQVASAGWDRCGEGNLCLFDLPNGEGDYIALSSPIELSLLGAWDNRVSSVWNRSSYFLDTYDGPNYQGLHTAWMSYIPPSNVQDLDLPDNSISSLVVR